MIIDEKHGRNVEGSGRGLFYGAILAFSWRELGKLRQTAGTKSILVA
jgi:hypothetical protein